MQKFINPAKKNVERRKSVDARRCRTACSSLPWFNPILKFLSASLFCILGAAIVAAQDKKVATPAQKDESNPVGKNAARFYGGVKNFLLLSAEKVPETHYSFKATEAVRSYGQIVGHIADSQYAMCAIVLGEKSPGGDIEKTKISKADLIAALKGAFAYCDKAYDGMTDASAGQTVKFMGSDTTKIGVLTANLIHSGLHYGNMITYMRLKNIVPPTSESDYFNAPKK